MHGLAPPEAPELLSGAEPRPVLDARHDVSTAPIRGEVQWKEACAENMFGPNALKTLGYFRGLRELYRGFESFSLQARAMARST
jgi:hypothetical protein